LIIKIWVEASGVRQFFVAVQGNGSFSADARGRVSTEDA